ncbi:hypothetical protein N24_3046 [Corynebacterium suranareeae]|uniref:Uncharacterized protein n=1 Tax=Corynebacterium suranareeae TaxID=2506452 RepID=A0A169S9A1_9CORY|nr:hypothetical protein N24_3046 [Corynebacterium suranareeae]
MQNSVAFWDPLNKNSVSSEQKLLLDSNEVLSPKKTRRTTKRPGFLIN